ncbi:Eco57I restriction-modification methylase domain-containing protein [Microbacterium paludicola]|uniref:Eco57I restriction-modification methylase domain-containing protein n=1 Tax=Microbacterium paludicola TaxID=300019 RepID=UPI003879AFBE
MSEKVALQLRNYNPDVLTCIANLSNDEVFTPPEFANRMLDTLEQAWADANGGASIWADPDVTFLDPFTKSGVFLREITRRLTDGLAEQIPDLDERVDHILTKQVYGIGITRLTSLLARRSLYCSKWANGPHSIARSFDTEEGNIWFERTEHTWSGGRLNHALLDAAGNPVVEGRRCRYCGAPERDYERGSGLETYAYEFIHTDDIRARIAELFGADMQFDVIIGNPPYQLGQSGGDAIGGFAMPVYQKFVQSAKSLEPRFAVLVTPSRWFAGGRGLDEFRNEMLIDRRLRALVDFPDSAEAFPGVEIKGGVSYFLWDREWNGDCLVSTVSGGVAGRAMSRNLAEYDVLVRRNEAVPILRKVLAGMTGEGVDNLAPRVSPIQPFSIRTSFRGAATSTGMTDPVVLYQNGGAGYIERVDVPRNHDWIDEWKVLLGGAYGAGESFPHQIVGAPIVAAPGSACTETYLVIKRFRTEVEARRFSNYLRTRFVRFLVSLRKYTQHIYNERFAFVPDLPMDRTWTDAELYAKYGITAEEQAFIESMIRPMDLSDD